MLRELLVRIVEQGGFLNEQDTRDLAQADRLRNVLVRCGNGRFVCAAQDVAHFIGAIEASGADYVRDVSLPSTDRAYLCDWSDVTRDPPRVAAPMPIRKSRASSGNQYSFNEAEIGGSFDGFHVTSDADPGL